MVPDLTSHPLLDHEPARATRPVLALTLKKLWGVVPFENFIREGIVRV